MQAEPGAAAPHPGGEERIERLPLGRRIHADAVVVETQQHLASGRAIAFQRLVRSRPSPSSALSPN